MMNQTEFIQEKEQLMNEMLNQLSSWNQGSEEAFQILATNDEAIERMRVIDKQLTNDQLTAYNEKHQDVWATIIQKQKTLNEWIRSERQKTSEQLTQMGKKEKVVSSYIGLQKKSIFIEKNY